MNRRKLPLGALAFAAGALFAGGLCLSGMTQPAKVIGFLDVTGAWDPSLILVMAGAVGTYAGLSRLIRRRSRPWVGDEFEIQGAKGGIDARLVAGAALFGIGWGLGGFCPGPGVVSAGALAGPGILFLVGMVGGQVLFEGISRRGPNSPSEGARDGRQTPAPSCG